MLLKIMCFNLNKNDKLEQNIQKRLGFIGKIGSLSGRPGTFIIRRKEETYRLPFLDMVCFIYFKVTVQSVLKGRGKNYVYGLRKQIMSITENGGNGPVARCTDGAYFLNPDKYERWRWYRILCIKNLAINQNLAFRVLAEFRWVRRNVTQSWGMGLRDKCLCRKLAIIGFTGWRERTGGPLYGGMNRYVIPGKIDGCQAIKPRSGAAYP